MSDRTRYWSRLVAAWEKSGLSQAEFCRRRQVKAGSFGWWKRRLVGTVGRPRRGNRGEGIRPAEVGRAFVEVGLPKTVLSAGSSAGMGLSCSPGGYEIALSKGRVIRLPHDFDLNLVAQLVTAVESC